MKKRFIFAVFLIIFMCGCNQVQAADHNITSFMSTETQSFVKSDSTITGMFSKDQKKELEKYFSQFLDSVKEDGTAEVFIPAGIGVTAKDLVQYMTAYDFGEVYRNTTYKSLKGSTGTKLKGSVNPELKKQNDLVNQYIVSETEGMAPTLENAKLLYEKIVNGFTYEMNDT